jgi:hypothetical protein
MHLPLSFTEHEHGGVPDVSTDSVIREQHILTRQTRRVVPLTWRIIGRFTWPVLLSSDAVGLYSEAPTCFNSLCNRRGPIPKCDYVLRNWSHFHALFHFMQSAVVLYSRVWKWSVHSPNMNLISTCRHWLDSRDEAVIHGNVIVSGETVRDTRNTLRVVVMSYFY